MQVKGRPIVPISVCLNDLSVGDLGVFDKNVRIGYPLAIRPAHEPFNREAMIGFVRCRGRRWKDNAQTECDECDRESLPLPQTEARSCRSRSGFKQQNASPRQASPVLRRMYLAQAPLVVNDGTGPEMSSFRRQASRVTWENGDPQVGYRCPRVRASASTRAASIRRSDSFLETQASQDFPLAVSSPVKAMDKMSW